MSVYIALIHKDENSCYGVAFPDLPGHVTAGDTIDEAIANAHHLLKLLNETWLEDTGHKMPLPSDFETLRSRLKVSDIMDDAIIIAVSTDHSPSYKHAAE
jgi:predicted RNase H-like HicB family nuclease